MYLQTAASPIWYLKIFFLKCSFNPKARLRGSCISFLRKENSIKEMRKKNQLEMEERFSLALEKTASDSRNGEPVIGKKQPNCT